jgi:hypothetical protein
MLMMLRTCPLRFFLTAIAAAGVAYVAAAATAKWCPPLGPVFTPPTGLAEHPLMRAALENLTVQLDAYTAGRNGSGVKGRYAANTTYSSVGIRFVDDPRTLFEHHHMPTPGGANDTTTATRNSRGLTAKLDADSVYRMASVSKVFTVLLLLLQEDKLSLGDPVTKYLPELAAAAAAGGNRTTVESVNWNDVTLGALTDSLSGIPYACECALSYIRIP